MINTSVNQTNTKTQIKSKKDRHQPFLVMENVYKEYPNGYRALENVNLNVAEGEFITLIGHSGCGKSTLLNMVSGFSHPSQGTVSINGQRITKPGPDRMVVFQGSLSCLGGRCLKMFIWRLILYFRISRRLKKMRSSMSIWRWWD